jgi:phosphatidylglycerol:prolipoprotein diacylglycerol transferase
MYPILFELNLPWIGAFPVRSFGVMVVLGVMVGMWWLASALRRLGVTERDAAADLAVACVLTGIFGARLLYVVIHPPPEGQSAFLWLFRIWEGGLVSYGGFFGGALGGIWFARKHKLPVRRLGDAILPALFLGQVFGRIGCFLVGDDYGKPWDGPWAVAFPKLEGGLIPDALVGVPLHPTQLYLSLMDVVIFLIAARVFARRRFDGQAVCVTMLMYAVGRFLLEFLRGDDAARGGWPPRPAAVPGDVSWVLSTSQWFSIGTFVLALLLYAAWRRGSVYPPHPADASASSPSPATPRAAT